MNLSDLKVGDFLEYKGRDTRNYKANYSYMVTEINLNASRIYFTNGFWFKFGLELDSLFRVPVKIHVRRVNTPAHQVCNFGELKEGDYFKFVGKKQVYIVSDIKKRGELTYSKTNDVWGSYVTKPKKWAKLVEIGFEY